MPYTYISNLLLVIGQFVLLVQTIHVKVFPDLLDLRVFQVDRQRGPQTPAFRFTEGADRSQTEATPWFHLDRDALDHTLTGAVLHSQNIVIILSTAQKRAPVPISVVMVSAQ